MNPPFLLPVRAVYEPSDATFPMISIEVYKQSQGFATELQVRKEFGRMDGRQGVYGLQFNDYQAFDNKVDAVAEVEMCAIVKHRDRKPAFLSSC